MHIWADIENSSGVKVGPGPLDSVSDFRAIPRLSRAGSFSFVAQVSDPNLSYFLETDGTTGTIRLIKKIVRIQGVVGGNVRTLGRGIIDKVTHIAPERVLIEGDDLLRELTYRRIFNNQFYVDTLYTPTVYFFNGLAYVTVTGATNVTLTDTDNFLFVGYLHPFNFIRMDMGATVNAVADNEGSWGFSVEGAVPTGSGWREPGTIDGTNVGGAPFAQDGDVEFTRPANWIPANVNGLTLYWMRFDPGIDLTANIRFAAIDAGIRTPVIDDIEQIINDHAPPGWGVDTIDWHAGTVNGTLREWQGETVLEALVKIAEQTGENFRLGDGREVEWLRNEIDDTLYLRATEPNSVNVEQDDELCYILQLEDERDSYDIVTRVYPFGAGNGDVQITLSDTTRSDAGYTLDTLTNYLEKNSAVSAFGRIDGVLYLRDIGSVDGSGANDRDASNALYDAAKAHLDKNSVPYRGYRLTVAGLNRVIKVGTAVVIDYRRVANGVVVWSVTGSFVVLETTNQVGSNGLFTSALQIANVTRYPMRDAGILAKQVGNLLDYQRHAQGVSADSVR